jgi:signal transduction histidine kinase
MGFPMTKSLLDLQLRETCQLTGGVWAVWLEHADGWEIFASYRVTKKQRTELEYFLKLPAVKTWLNGALTGDRVRSGRFKKEPEAFGKRIFAFPNQVTHRIILVSAIELSAAAKRFWKALVIGDPGRLFLTPAPIPELLNIESVAYHLPRALDRILDIILQTGSYQGGWLAIRSGDFLEIKAYLNCVDCQDMRLPVEANPLLRGLIQSRQARIVRKNDAEWVMTPRLGFTASTDIWVALPLVIGRRLIGLVAIWGEIPFQSEIWEKLKVLSIRIAPSVEASITFTDLTNHLQRLALLNDFSVTISSSLDLDQIVQRTFALLRRAFSTERINLMILSSDGSGVQNYFDHDALIIAQTLTNEPLPALIERGEVFRIDTIMEESAYKPVYPGSQSALVIPLKYRKQIIGALSLENIKQWAFTLYDEHLLAVIASHLTGLLENGRLRREAEARARNLSLIHEVVKHVIGLGDVRQVAQIAAELMARNFDYELAGVALVMGSEKELQLAGIGGNAADLVQHGLKYMVTNRENGIVMRVVNTGESLLVNDVKHDPVYLPVPDWDAGSEMCVPLKNGENVLGAIDVESKRKNAFSQNDLIVLESLAGILASVISNVGQYQELQATVDQLRATREELQERMNAQHMAESRLVQAAKLAAVGEMAAGVAHELNNPLTTVSGFTELALEELPKDSPLYADLELVLRESRRARDVVRRLLDFTRQSESQRVPSSMNDIVTEIIALVNHLLHTNGVQLFLALSDGLPRVSVDRNQVKQVILNLIHNALHAMPKGGELHITSAKRKRDHRDWFILAVADNGSGISPENLERIFEPFFTTRAKDGGTGLGLSISYGIVAGHSGFIEAESQMGKGSTFTVWLPIEVV